MTAGMLTIGADNPAYPPYFGGTPPGAGRGSSATPPTARASRARSPMRSPRRWASRPPGRLGGRPFNNAIQPGPKPFDIYLTQVSYSADRTKAVDLTDGYFDLNQAVVALKDTPISKAPAVAGLKAFKLGAPVGTTSYTYITDNIQPTKAPSVYNDLDGRIEALQAKQIDGHRGRPADGLLHARRQLTGRRDRRLPADRRRRRALQRPADQGQHADPLRQPGDRASIKADGTLAAACARNGSTTRARRP